VTPLLIRDLRQSPFNVGVRVELADFTLAEVGELNRRYGDPLRSPDELACFVRFVGGNPCLVQRGLHTMVTRSLALEELEEQAEEVVGEHLRSVLAPLLRHEPTVEGLRTVRDGREGLDPDLFLQLRAAGVLTGDAPRRAALRCQLYGRYLALRLETRGLLAG
jgi:hypothetical protein